MKIDLNAEIETARNQIKHHNRLSILQPLTEAIKNSLQAKATQIDISFNLAKYQNLSGETNFIINDYKIKDNGTGFLEEDIEVFSTLKKKHHNNSNKQGCKGFSRIVSLVYFDSIEIETFNGNNLYEINFSSDFDTNKNIIKTSSKKTPETTVSFQKAKAEFKNQHYTLNHINQIKDYIRDKLYIFLSLLQENFTINIEFDEYKASLKNNDIKPDLITKDFYIDQQLFKLHYALTKKKPTENIFKSINGLCAHGEKVQDIMKSFAFSSSYDYIFLITSDFLDKRVNNERSGFYEFKDSLSIEITFKEIEDKFLETLNTVINSLPEKEQEDLKQEKQKQKQHFIKDYPYLQHFIKETNLNNFKNDHYLSANNAFQQALKDSRKIKETIINEKITEEIKKKVTKSNIINETLLAQYIYYRDTIVEYLGRLASTEAKEQELHRLFDANKTSSDNKEASNIWLLDDAFMAYDDFLSETQIKNIIGSGDNKDRVDLFISFNNSTTNKKEKCILVEFKDLKKKRSASEKGKAMGSQTQLQDYARAIKKAYPELKFIYAYAILGFDEYFIQTLRDNEYLDSFTTRGKILWRTFNLNNKTEDEFNLTIYFIEIDNIINDAKARNKTFLDILTKHNKN